MSTWKLAIPAACLLLLTAYGPASAQSSSGEVKIKVKNPAGATVVQFKPRGQDIKVEYDHNGQTLVLRGKQSKSGKRKYQLEGAGPFAEVKPTDSGFKVRTPGAELLWKVKISGYKTKISNNEENRNPFVLKTDDDRVKIFRNESTDIGRVKFYFDRGKIKVKDLQGNELFASNTDRYSAAFGLLMADEIPPAERYILMAELLMLDR